MNPWPKLANFPQSIIKRSNARNLQCLRASLNLVCGILAWVQWCEYTIIDTLIHQHIVAKSDGYFLDLLFQLTLGYILYPIRVSKKVKNTKTKYIKLQIMCVLMKPLRNILPQVTRCIQKCAESLNRQAHYFLTYICVCTYLCNFQREI